jgi:hypothetical protein
MGRLIELPPRLHGLPLFVFLTALPIAENEPRMRREQTIRC